MPLAAPQRVRRWVPIYRWQNHGEFTMVFNTLLNWNDMARAARPAVAGTAPQR